jgi:hypothetical protein
MGWHEFPLRNPGTGCDILPANLLEHFYFVYPLFDSQGDNIPASNLNRGAKDKQLLESFSLFTGQKMAANLFFKRTQVIIPHHKNLVTGSTVLVGKFNRAQVADDAQSEQQVLSLPG